MSITLKLAHEDGIRLRQQSAHKTDQKDKDGTVVTRVDWRFMKRQEPNGQTVEECSQDEDFRRVGADGKKIKLGTYTVHVTYGMNNLVVERKGKVAPFSFKNPAIRNQVRMQYQKLEPTSKKTKDEKVIHEWKNDGPAQYVPPNSFSGAYVGDGQRVIVDEMPT